MTYKERFGNVENYNKFCANQMLNYYEEMGVPYTFTGTVINLLTYSECYMNKDMIERKHKALENIEYLKKVANGELMDSLYTYQYKLFENTEYHSL